jgi:hypothetical protein
MEISPVAGVRIAPMIRSRETDLGLTDVYEVERLSRTGDETYTPSRARAEASLDDEDMSDDFANGPESQDRELTTGAIQIDYIA